jgi:hypothetical protein
MDAITTKQLGSPSNPEESPFVDPVPEMMSLEQIDVAMKAKILRRATLNMQSAKLNNIVYNLELLGLAIMWYGQVSNFSFLSLLTW